MRVPGPIRRAGEHPFAWGVVLLAVVLAGVFGDVLFVDRNTIASSAYTDVYAYFVPARDFGFGELRHGNLPLWNPYLFSGTPCLGNFQSALLYPPNYLHLVLPLAAAINATIVLHLFLIGLFMMLWARSRGLHPAACLFAGVMVMFSGAYYLHVAGGHLTMLCAVAWMPLLFLAIDRILDAGSAEWCLAGAVAGTMQVLAGWPHVLFYTAVAAGPYTVFCLARAPRRGRAVALLAVAALAPLVLGAAQLWPGIQTALESVRQGGKSYEFTTSFSFPPENLLTLIAPGFFGMVHIEPYWGRWFAWEMCAFVGLTGLTLCVYGAISGQPKARRFAAFMAVGLALTALGRYTPLYRVLYAVVPGFGAFRAPARFMMPATMFAGILAAAGLDSLLAGRRPSRVLAGEVIALAAILALGGVAVARSAEGDPAESTWGAAMRAVPDTGDMCRAYRENGVARAGRFAAKGLWTAAATACAAGTLLLLARRAPWPVYALAALGILELAVFARTCRPTFELGHTRIPELEAFYALHPGDYRVLSPGYQNHALLSRVRNIWGYDPLLSQRYADFIRLTTGQDREDAARKLDFSRDHPLLRVLRQRFEVESTEAGLHVHPVTAGEPLPRLLLVEDWRVAAGRDAILDALGAPAFDPWNTVILEAEPPGLPRDGARGDASTPRLIDESTDHITVEVDVARPAVLLVTESYNPGWRAYSLDDAPPQERYDVVPGDYAFQAVPLAPGHHRIRIEYAPWTFRVGKWVSLTSAGFVGLLGAWLLVRRGRAARGDPA
ncbi:MAG: hypothetical protein JXR94_09385 [Candidatus Hydrogenedentes bacterium]|nr:hypothetical protein [Candidatus Hydrogenedentota bacterium]